jgi:hypothetical protein
MLEYYTANKSRTKHFTLEISTSKNLGSKRLYVKNPFKFGDPNKWLLAFRSHDDKGICVQDPVNRVTRKYEFFPKLGLSKLGGKPLGGGSGVFRLPFQFRLDKGIEREKQVEADLNKIDMPYFVHRLPLSGSGGNGADIVISKEKHPEGMWEHNEGYVVNPYETTRYGIAAIDVNGVSIKDRQPKFTYRYGKDFTKYKESCESMRTIPFIGWVYDGQIRYMHLSKENIEAVFFTDHGSGGYRQRTGYAPVEIALRKGMDRSGLIPKIEKERMYI